MPDSHSGPRPHPASRSEATAGTSPVTGPGGDGPPRSGGHAADRPGSPFDWLDHHAEWRREAGLSRTLRPRPADSPLLDLASNDYLGLARDHRVVRAAADAALLWGAGSTGSRLVTGSTELHRQLEEELAAFCGAEAALVFSSGYAANLAAVTSLTGPDTLIVSDAANHASLIDGCRLSRALTSVVAHADAEAVGKELASHDGRAIVLTDTVFSVDGDAAPLRELAAVARGQGAGLVVDDAHGLGVLGPGGAGAVAAAGLEGSHDIVTTMTLSKSLGSQGGAVLGPSRVIRHLVDNARTFIFDTGLAPAAVGAALAALRIVREEPARPRRAREVAADLARRLAAEGLRVSRPDAAVVSVRAPSPEAAVEWAARCRAAGVLVGCFRPPSVPDGISRIRLTARADLSAAETAEAVRVLVRTAPAG